MISNLFIPTATLPKDKIEKRCDWGLSSSIQGEIRDIEISI